MKRRNLLIVVRTCGRVFAQHGARYVKKSKHEIINTCLSSLVNSINQVKDHDIKLVCVDDHSSEECVRDIKAILSKCSADTEFIALEQTGNGPSMGFVYQLVEQQSTDLWYHVEDDYLHKPEAIGDMIDSVSQFEINTGRMVAVNPHDDPWRYRNIYESYLLYGPYRHYRTVAHSTYTCLASRAIYDQYQQHFKNLVELTNRRADWVEDKSINLVWQKPDVLLFSPIPGLAFHLMDESGRDPYLDFDALWSSIPELWK